MAHRALSIPDIVYLVFDQVGEDKSTLARSARCCKAFHNPALDMLWSDLPSVFPLWNLLPPMKGRMIVSTDLFVKNNNLVLTVLAGTRA
jgi:hypothetical protein